MPSELPIVDVVGVGLNATDTLIRVPHFPALDSKVRLIETVTRAGGALGTEIPVIVIGACCGAAGARVADTIPVEAEDAA